MHFNQDLLQQKLQAIMAKQNDGEYVPKKVRDKAKKKKEKAIQAANDKQEREISKRVREIAKARKIKQYEAEKGSPAEIDYALGKKANSREKPLPTRKINLQELIPVKIDQKTTVYVKPGSDIEAIKAKYKRQTFDRFESLPPTYQF